MAATEQLGIAVYQNASADPAPQARLEALDRALAGRKRPGPDIVLCPELFLSGYCAGAGLAKLAEPPDGPFARQVAGIARWHGCSIVYGYPEAVESGLYNAAVAIGKDGSRLANHRKIVLPTEYEKAWFQPGHDLTFFTLAGWKVGVIVCYEVEFPEIVRACAVEGADLVVVPTALTTEWGVVARKVVPARAFENGVYIAYANHGGRDGDFEYLGESCIVGPDGNDLARAGSEEALIEAVLDHAALPRLRSRLPYLADSEGLASLRRTTSPASRRKVPSPEAT